MAKKRAAPPPNPLHPDLLGLLASCRAAPADDTPRLVVADWLDEFADTSGLPSEEDARSRAELLRVQVELARPSLDVTRVAELRAAERRLLAAHAEGWLGDLPRRLHDLAQRTLGFIGPSPAQPRPYTFDPFHLGNRWRFARGLLTVSLQPSDVSDAQLGRWFAGPLASWVESATVSVGPRDLTTLAPGGALRPLLGAHLALGAGQPNTMNPFQPPPQVLTAHDCRAGLRHPNFALVRSIGVFEAAAEAGAVRMLAARDLSNVRWLELHGPLSADDAVALAAAPLAGLSGLSVAKTGLTAAGFAALCRSPHLRQLAHLSAFRNPIGCDGAVALAESPLANDLRVCDLQNTGLGDRGTAALAGSPLFRRLYGPGLNLSMNPIGDAGARALAACDGLARFTELILRECHVGDAGAASLAGSSHVADLAYLDLFRNRIGDPGAAALAGSSLLANVRDLSLRSNAITASGAGLLRATYGDRAKV